MHEIWLESHEPFCHIGVDDEIISSIVPKYSKKQSIFDKKGKDVVG